MSVRDPVVKRQLPFRPVDMVSAGGGCEVAVTVGTGCSDLGLWNVVSNCMKRVFLLEAAYRVM